ncbi:hypothetical protein CNQ87_10630 [Lysinibacillus fusiformis]|uniref:hypothetical protein n=1 Tax=Lysinibacillus fusiformis TaxID=28031 RepID=UPI000BBAE615|nr:hypothetical protein [Lysinibacillus fusiformis]PCD84788.1 hypothetical protein CNQ87_10630 [Lysinibacillus fusiformis]
MEPWKEKVIKKAKHAQFLLDTNNQEKLINYFISNFIQPIADEVTEINEDFYSINQDGTQTKIKIANEELLIMISNGNVGFCKLNKGKDTWKMILKVIFEDSVPKVIGNIIPEELTIKDLENVMVEVFK